MAIEKSDGIKQKCDFRVSELCCSGEAITSNDVISDEFNLPGVTGIIKEDLYIEEHKRG